MVSKAYLSGVLKSRFTGLAGVFLLSVVMLFLFYGKILLSLNTTFFSTEGDGILCYYNSCYLAKYDTSLLYSRSMNYPYGEIAFYTQSQPLLIGILKAIPENLADAAGHTVGIINFLMLFSIVLAAVFLYLFLTETGLPVYMALLTSVGVAFLSPQIDRFGGHFTLSYVWALPLLLYLLLMFHRKRRKITYSLVTGIVLFVLMTGHVYFAAFFAIAVVFYWIMLPFNREKGASEPLTKMALCLLLQLILPVVVFYMISGHFAHLTPDRPLKPYGFLVYKSSPESVLLPLWVDYGRFLHKIRSFNYVQWEGISYVGLTAAIGFLILVVGFFRKVYRRNWKAAFQVTDNHFLNVMFWASFLALLYSFGIPFIFGLEFLVGYLGPLQQMRAIGRFAWLFYFVINIVVFYRLWHWQRAQRRKPLPVILLFLGVAMLYADVYFYLKNRQASIDHRFTAWSDRQNQDPENQWVTRTDPSQYQAILPLPFYHMGSDNYGISPRCEMLANSFLVSVKTRLPVAAIYMSRASVTQSVRNIAMVLEPYRPLEIMQDFPDKRPFLIVAGKCNDYTPEETDLLRQGTKIDSNASFSLYRLPYDSLSQMSLKRSREIASEFAGNLFPDHEPVYKSIPEARVEKLTFDDNDNGKGYPVGNALQIMGQSKAILFDHPLSGDTDTIYSFNFWVNPVNADLVPKTRLEIELFNPQGTRVDYQNMMLGNCLKTVDGAWGLIEYKFQTAEPGNRLKITVYNTLLAGKYVYYVDEVMIRPDHCDVYERRNNYLVKNNRWYFVR